MDKTTIFFAKNLDENIRLDKFLTNKLKNLTRSQIKKIIISKSVKIDNNITVMASEKIKNGNRIDVLIQKHNLIKIQQYDGHSFPFPDNCFDTVMFIDVLHHTNFSVQLLKEAFRVARRHVIIKDHLCESRLAWCTLMILDWAGNMPYKIKVPCNYFSRVQWEKNFQKASLIVDTWHSSVKTYPLPLSLVFDRYYNFITRLSKP